MRRTNMLKAGLALLAISLAGGCTDGGQPLLIMQNNVPDVGCSVSNDVTSAFIPRGRIDTNAEAGYVFTPVVQNVSEVLSNQTQSQRTAFIEGANIKLSVQAGFFGDSPPTDDPNFKLFTKFSKGFSGNVAPEGGFTSFIFTIMEKDFMTQFLAPGLGDPTSSVQIHAKITLFGTAGGGGSVESVPYDYFIDVCNGCMQVDQGPCAALPDGFEGGIGGACNTLQDEVLDCCTNADSTVQCPAAVTTEDEGA